MGKAYIKDEGKRLKIVLRFMYYVLRNPYLLIRREIRVHNNKPIEPDAL